MGLAVEDEVLNEDVLPDDDTGNQVLPSPILIKIPDR